MIRKWKFVVPALAMLVMSSVHAQAAYVYVGSWDLITLGGLSNGQYNNSNPYWWQLNPPVYNALEAAAVIFGGNPSDYAISTVDTNPANINNLAYVDGWGDTQYLINPVSETFKLDLGNPGYNDPAGTGTAYSALVFDHGPSFPNSINHAFRRVNGEVPEPASMALLGIGSLGLVFGRAVRSRKQSA